MNSARLWIFIGVFSVCALEGVGENCITSADCTSAIGVTCENGICKCDPRQQYRYVESDCVTDINECGSNPCKNGATCIDGIYGYTCKCIAGFSGTNCQTNTNQCASNPCKNGATCNDVINGYICKCIAGFTGTNCQTNINECASNPCKNGATCTDGINRYTCKCVAGFTGTYCQTNINECASNPCKNGATCIDGINRYTCKCVAGFTGTYCQTRKELGAACSGVQYECADTAAQCLNQKCTCGANYYDSDGFTDGGTCYAVTNLQVSGITFQSVTNSGFTVSWTPPSKSAALQISSYLVEWKLKSQDNNLNGGNKEVTSTVTSVNIGTGITQGKTFIVTVTSKNIWTQNNVTRTTSVWKEQASKPGIPGTVDKQRSDLNASNGPRITLYWKPPAGGVSGYKVRLFDAVNTTSTFDVTSAVKQFTPNWLKNGHRYNITIQAKSEAFDNGKVVLGEVYREEIKTVVSVANPCNSDSSCKTEAVIVGVVLGSLNVIQLVYATILLRRYRANKGDNAKHDTKSNRSGHFYANEIFMVGTVEDENTVAAVNSKTEYSRLDDNKRDDTIYDIIKAK